MPWTTLNVESRHTKGADVSYLKQSTTDAKPIPERK